MIACGGSCEEQEEMVTVLQKGKSFGAGDAAV